ncbi:MAG TPA: hypothetical protein VME45_18500 [Stellaceae bacterium]|nr:hypothetical protein [Stellaceae bacterium]
MSRITKARFAVLLAAGCCLALSVPVPARADGLDQFKKVIEPQIPPGTFSYKSGKALGDDGFELDDAVYAPPAADPKSAKPDPISIKTITVEHFDFDSAAKQLTPLYAKVKFDGVTSGGNAAGFDLKQMAGIDNISADFGLDYRLDPDKRVFTLKRLELNLNGLGKLEATVVVDGLSADAATKPDDAMKDASLKSAQFTYDDHSLLAKAVPVAAAMQGTDPKAMIALAIAFLDGARTDQGQAAQQAIDSLVAYAEDYQKPKGPLKVTLNPPGDVSNADLGNAKTADDIVKLLGIQVSYAGTRSSKPGETAATLAPGAKDVPAKDEDEDKPATLDKKKD